MQGEVRAVLRDAVKEGAWSRVDLDTRIAAQFAGTSDGEEIPELRGCTIAPPAID